MMTIRPTSGCTRGTAKRATSAITAATAAAPPTIARSRASYGTRGGATCSASPSAAPVIRPSLDWRGPLHPAKLTTLRSLFAARSPPFPRSGSGHSRFRRDHAGAFGGGGRSFAANHVLRDERSRRWRRVGNPHRSIEQRQRVGESASRPVMHPQHRFAATNCRAQRRHDLDPDAWIDHIVQLSAAGTERDGGAANLLGEERRHMAVTSRDDVVSVRGRWQEIVSIDDPWVAALKLDDRPQLLHTGTGHERRVDARHRS